MPKKHTPSISLFERLTLLLLLLVAAGLRLGAQSYASQLPFWTHHRLDAQIYHEAGLRIASGDWGLGQQVLHMSPLYSYTVGLLYTLFGSKPWVMPLFQSLLGLGLIWLVWATARRLWGHAGWALLSAALCAFYGPSLFYEGHTLATSLGTFLWGLLVWLSIRAIDISLTKSPEATIVPPETSEDRSKNEETPSHSFTPRQADATVLWAWGWLGLGWGLSVILRPNALILFPLFVFAALYLFRKSFWKPLFAMFLVSAVVISPVTLRNRLIAGEWVLVTDSGGFNFYIGNGQGAHGTFRRPPGLEAAGHPAQQFALYRKVAEQASGRRLKSSEVDAFWYRQTWQDIRQDPMRWLRLLRNKLWLFWGAAELSNSQDYEFTRRLNPILRAPLVQFGWLSPWASLGLLLLLWRGLLRLLGKTSQETEKESIRGLWIGLTTSALMAALVGFFILGHYRAILLVSFILLSVAAFRQVLQWSRRSPLKSVAFVAIAIAAYPLVYTAKLERSLAEEYFKLGYAYHVQGRLAKAERSYLKALQHDAQHLSSHKNLARLYETSQRNDEARFHWQQLLEAPRASRSLKILALQHLSRQVRPPTTTPTTTRPTSPPTSPPHR
ncbi:MAG: glycosyltransferase family 39 protein [Myxococcales bacterium]|nr:glycosyltransferase family 39 protein [Myxococcales bacterium]